MLACRVCLLGIEAAEVVYNVLVLLPGSRDRLNLCNCVTLVCLLYQANPYLMVATASSVAVHCAIIYNPFLVS